MADAAASPGAAARERLTAALQGLGDALRLKAHQPEVQELISIWDLRSRAVLAAVDSAEGGLGGAAAAPVAAAADLLQLLPAFAAPGAEGVVEALIAAARREEGPARSNAFIILAELTRFDADAAERATSTDAGAALLALAVERMQSAAAPGAASPSAALELLGPLRLLNDVARPAAPAAARARACATPGLAGAAADLLVALASEEWAATRDEVERPCQQLEADTLLVLASLMGAASPVCYTQAFEALTLRRGALPRVLALLRSPCPKVRSAAVCCIGAIGGEKAGADALFKMRRAAVELVAALRRAHADGEDPALVQVPATNALAQLLDHSEGQRVAEALARAAAAEGAAGSLLGALVGLIAASLDGDDCPRDKWGRGVHAVVLLCHVVAASTAEQLPVLRRAPRLAEVCVRAMHYWLKEASDEHMGVHTLLVFAVAVMAGFDAVHAVHAHHPPAATADTAAARAALPGAPGMEGRLRRYLGWGRRQPSSVTFVTNTVVAAKWLLKLPEVRPAAAATPAAAVVAAAAAAADPTVVPAPAAAAAPLPPPADAGVRAVEQPESKAGSSDGGADGSSGSGTGSGGSGASGSGAEAAAQPRVCGRCGKSGAADVPLLRCVGCKAQYYCGDACATAHWRAHRAACKATRRAARRAAAAQRS
ncbi:hypothetical protein Rsub_00932 [Raphidocelis subcapitata]|uniref:MYND-type domain-containing protein n=1 Tax=Raphidocelis subcapitata TaxID=307507 RepID=A0A2V0NRM6_9CHLO|nr:hypothetical protein Rsub_00932 [Raphidocelis subcapitata]|eukprot:GBF88220.1 hypothetical protein Rsub_00932 [Raphidocelis subcapitata]